MQSPVSVVIPTYQCAHYVRQAVESVLEQRYPCELVEIIVVDDGSTDNTREVLKPFGHRIRYLRQPNRGLSCARNAGIRVAQANLVAFLDADDYWFPDFLVAVSEAAKLHTDCLITSDFFESFDEKIMDVSFYRRKGLHWAFDLPAAEQLRVALEASFPVPSLTMVPQTIFSQVGLFDETLRYAEDSDFFYRCMAAGCRVVLVPQPLGVYRRSRPGALTARLTLSRAHDRARILSRYKNQVSSRRLSDVLGTMHHIGFNEAVAQRSFGDAARHALQLVLNPRYLRILLTKKGEQLINIITKGSSGRRSY